MIFSLFEFLLNIDRGVTTLKRLGNAGVVERERHEFR